MSTITNETLQKAVDECEAVLSRYDLAGLIIVSSAEHSKYLAKLDPSWSCSRIEAGTLKFWANSETHPDPEKRKAAVTDTIAMISGLRTITEAMCENFTAALLTLSKRFQILSSNRLES